MSETAGLGALGSPTTDAVLSSKEKRYFRRIFESSTMGEESASSAQQQAVAKAQPHLGGKLDIKI